MAVVLFSNNASSTLTATASTSQTTLEIQTVDAVEFPSPTAGDWFPVTLVEALNMEIVRCTARSGTTLTVVRAQEGTTAKNFGIGATVEHRLTKAALDTFLQETEPSLIYIGDGPPASPVHGQPWWESDTGNLQIYFDDGSSAQWVAAHVGPPPYGGIGGGGGGGIEEAPINGQQYARFNATWAVVTGGGGGSTAWVDITGKPATFPPTLPIAQSGVTNLVTDLSGKEPTITSGTTAQYWRGDKSWQTLPAGGSGDVVGPAGATDNAIARFSTTTGKLLKDNPNFTLTDTGILALKVGANTVMGHDPTNQNGTFVIQAQPPHGQFLAITPRNNTNGALTLSSGGGFYFDSAISIGAGSPTSNLVALSSQASGTTRALKVGSGLINLAHGAAPSAPTNGDIWTTATGVMARINGATQQISPGWVQMTQAAYDALTPKDPNMLYVVVG